MAKIDCSITANFLNEWYRMCETNRETCMTTCPFSRDKTGAGVSCNVFVREAPEKAIKIVQKWSDKHPTKTRLGDLLEKYPKTYISSGDTPSMRPYMLGYCENCDDCVYSHCEAEVCWHEPLVGGATGKEVE